MKNKAILLGLSTIIISILIMISNAHALGIAPAKIIIDYELGESREYTMTSRVINNEGRDVAVRISAAGELSQYVEIPEPLMYMVSDMPESEFTYKITLPPNIQSGTKILNIIVSEVDIRNQGDKGSSIGGLLTVTQQVYINIPYKGKYLEGTLSTYPTEQPGKTLSMVNLDNKGTESIVSINSNIKVSDISGNIIYEKTINTYNNLAVKKSIKIEEPIELSQPGKYTLKYDINYDDKSIVIQKEFENGKYNISITSATVENFKLGTVAKFDINTTTNWNTPIDGVYGEIIIKNIDGTTINTIKTDTKTIKPKDDILTAYWDTTSIKSGEYMINITLHAGTQTSTKEYQTTITENKITVKNENPATETIDNKTYIRTTMILAIATMTAIILLSIITQKKKKT
jgi:predicted  nucleic acid-binding Zn-ribbon protein